MKLLINILKKLSITLGIIILVIVGVGYFSNEHHEAETSVLFETSEEEIWEALNQLKNLHENQFFVKDIELTGLNEVNKQMWRENLIPWGHLDFEITEELEGEKLTHHMMDSSFGWTGTWNYTVIENESIDVTTLNISEETEITNLFVRGITTMIGRTFYTKYELQLIEDYLAQ